ncbi:MAG: MATE family efflux transporter [Proteobacteria bacterium]|nr:MATE family efflux transporter [Pseudomonadota bacterium]
MRPTFRQNANGRPSPLLTGPVGATLVRLAAPMVLGVAAIVLFNVVDTFFVGQLGALELAAMSFTFPVVLVVMSVSMGLSVATTSVVSRAIGSGDTAGVIRLTTHALILAYGVVILLCVLGILTIDPLFRVLGATEDILPLIKQYMIPWYLGVGFLVIPMVGNGTIRATGDTKTPSFVMIFAGVVNVILDPILIFGLGPIPRLELQGAAIATVISRSLTFLAALWILHKRERLIEWSLPKVNQMWASWKQVLYIGAPAAGARMLIPLSTGVLTRMVAGYGPQAVAAYGVGQRLESLVLIGVGAFGAAMTPFIGQNFGAGQYDRVRLAFGFGVKIALVLGIVMMVVLALAARPLAALFNDDPVVVTSAIQFLWIVPISYGLYGIATLAIETFNALNRPLHAVVLISIRLFVLAIPLAWAGSQWLDVPGIFGGISAANILIGVVAFVFTKRTLKRLDPS